MSESEYKCIKKERVIDARIRIIREWRDDWDRFDTNLKIIIGNEQIDVFQRGLTSCGLQEDLLNTIQRVDSKTKVTDGISKVDES